MIKFANYFLSRKHTQSLKDLTALLKVLTTLTTNKVGSISYFFSNSLLDVLNRMISVCRSVIYGCEFTTSIWLCSVSVG